MLSPGPALRRLLRGPAREGLRAHPRDRLDQLFALAVLGKGLNGLAEVVGGVVLLVAGPTTLQHLAVAWTRAELSEDPRDLVANQILRTADGLTGPAVLYGAVYLLSHGAVKIVLVGALLRDRLWAYPWTIAVLLAFIGYQLYRLTIAVSAGLVALTVFDAVVVALTWREYRRKRRRS